MWKQTSGTAIDNHNLIGGYEPIQLASINLRGRRLPLKKDLENFNINIGLAKKFIWGSCYILQNPIYLVKC